jgi:hypothetical protein
LNIDIRIIGEDYMEKPFTGMDLDTPVYFNKRKHFWSSTDLKRRVIEND